MLISLCKTQFCYKKLGQKPERNAPQHALPCRVKAPWWHCGGAGLLAVCQQLVLFLLFKAEIFSVLNY